MINSLQYKVEHHLMVTPLIWPPRCYGHFILARTMAQSFSYLKNPFNAARFFNLLLVCDRVTGLHCVA